MTATILSVSSIQENLVIPLHPPLEKGELIKLKNSTTPSFLKRGRGDYK
jgi:hypothetical protein